MYLFLKEGNAVDQVYKEFAKQRQHLNDAEGAFESRLAPILSRLQTLSSWSDVGSISTGWSGEWMEVRLKPDRRDSALPRGITQEFWVDGEKSPAYGGEDIRVAFQVGGVRLEVGGYLPPSCRIVEEEAFVPGHMSKQYRVVCNEEVPDGT